MRNGFAAVALALVLGTGWVWGYGGWNAAPPSEASERPADPYSTAAAPRHLYGQPTHGVSMVLIRDQGRPACGLAARRGEPLTRKRKPATAHPGTASCSLPR